MGTVWTEPEKYLTEIHQALGCHSAYMVEEIERLKDREDELGQQVTTLERDKSQLRADLAAAQRERDEARARVAELEADAAPLTPRRCVTCAQEAAREMRDKCAKFFADLCVDYDTGKRTIHPDVPLKDMGEWQRGIMHWVLVAIERDALKDTRALPLPSCDGCNPLKPEAKDEATR